MLLDFMKFCATWCLLLLVLLVCDAREVLPPHAYENRTLYPVLPVYDRRPLLSIGVLSDIQYTDQEEASRRHFRLSLNKLKHAVSEMNANRSHLDLVMHLGDTVNDNIKKNIVEINSRLKELRFPFFQVLGNHDFQLLSEEQRGQVPHLLGMPARYYSLRAGEGSAFLLIVLDGTDMSLYATTAGTVRRAEAEAMARRYRSRKSMRDFNGGIGEEQMRWLRAQLEYATSQNLVTLVLCHFPMYPYKQVLNLWNDVEVVQLLSQYPCVAAVVTGHTHRWEYKTLLVPHRNGSFTIHFITFGGIVQSPFTSWGFLEVYEKELHAHGLTFGRAFDYHMPIGGMRRLGAEMSPDAIRMPIRRRAVTLVSRCGDGDGQTRPPLQEVVQLAAIDTDELPSSIDAGWVLGLPLVLIVAVLVCMRCWRYRRSQRASTNGGLEGSGRWKN
ncbi:serine/threonine protein phosphatase [Trypanosoma grayi]|uniref:serine/threonine protein phosphatase n=1 Tax=Trypanosoma grayi TaxID=71804 RepID=UPI0004F47EAF|nr:serine/threonine protein phosphatase [Trypanosoma grayi]KEG14696.1 serine/threonine protein phosphatase [Trypanosoma grayi]